jgi:hypothetical protein
MPQGLGSGLAMWSIQVSMAWRMCIGNGPASLTWRLAHKLEGWLVLECCCCQGRRSPFILMLAVFVVFVMD